MRPTIHMMRHGSCSFMAIIKRDPRSSRSASGQVGQTAIQHGNPFFRQNPGLLFGRTRSCQVLDEFVRIEGKGGMVHRPCVRNMSMITCLAFVTSGFMPFNRVCLWLEW